MALPPQQLPARGPRAPPELQMLQDSVLPESFYPPGRQRAPFKGFVEPQDFSTPWTSPSLPAADTSTLGFGAAALPGAALLGPGGCGSLPAWAAPGTPQGPVRDLEPQSHRGRGAEAPAAPALPAPSPRNEETEEVPEGFDLWSTATSLGTPSGSNSPAGSRSPAGSDIPSSSSDDEDSWDLVNPEEDTGATEGIHLGEALHDFGMSQDMMEAIQDVPGDVTTPGDPGVTKGKEGGVAPAAPVGVNFICGHKNSEGVSAESRLSGTATSMGTPPGSNSPSGGHVPPSPAVQCHCQGTGELDFMREYAREVEEAVRSLELYKELEGVMEEGPILSPSACHVLSSPVAHPYYQGPVEEEFYTWEYAREVEETVCSLELYKELEGVRQEGPGSSPMAGEPGGLGSSPPARAGIKRGGSHFPTPSTKRRAPLRRD